MACTPFRSVLGVVCLCGRMLPEHICKSEINPMNETLSKDSVFKSSDPLTLLLPRTKASTKRNAHRVRGYCLYCSLNIVPCCNVC